MSNAEKAIEVYEMNMLTLRRAIRAASGEPDVILSSEGARTFLRTLAVNDIRLTATYGGVTGVMPSDRQS